MEPRQKWDLAADLAPAALAPHPPGATGSRAGLAALTLGCLLLVGALALVYLGQAGAVADANARWQAEQVAQTRLLRQEQEAQAQLATAQSVTYIEARAHALGMAPVPPSAITIIVVAAPTVAPATPGGQP